jgi:hypothetical protein
MAGVLVICGYNAVLCLNVVFPSFLRFVATEEGIFKDGQVVFADNEIIILLCAIRNHVTKQRDPDY